MVLKFLTAKEEAAQRRELQNFCKKDFVRMYSFMKEIQSVRLEEQEKNISLTDEEANALYDLQYIMTDDTWKTLKLNKMDKTVRKFFEKLERRVCPGLYK